MSAWVALVIVSLAVLVDCFWLDIDGKRWGWMKSWSKTYKILFFAGFIAVSIAIYLALGVEYV
ncbi:hypothetical protein [Bacillus sp. FJAT-42315]|uniref:hypothetical protein n=1 Tax=Bacillus sp. FJAT-42315 TaxID=2014077 RepID=UPI000C242E97|nr:hypothetical protein [Bacillus sp. FJAT-42315]